MQPSAKERGAVCSIKHLAYRGPDQDFVGRLNVDRNVECAEGMSKRYRPWTWSRHFRRPTRFDPPEHPSCSVRDLNLDGTQPLNPTELRLDHGT